MKKSIGMAFIFSLAVIILLNFLFFIIGFSVDGALNEQLDFISDEPAWMFYILVRPMVAFLWEIGNWMNEASGNDGQQIMYLAMMITIILAAIIAGLSGGNFQNAILGWILTCIVCIIMALIAASMIEDVNWIVSGHRSYHFADGVSWIIIKGIENMVICGAITMLVAFIREKLKSPK